MSGFNNPVYDEGGDKGNLVENSTKMSELEEFLKIEQILETLMVETKEREMDISILNSRRYNIAESEGQMTGNGNAPSSIKIGSLEFPFTPFEMETTKESTKESFTKHYMNYFALLGHADNVDEFNYDYITSLCRFTDVNLTDIHGQTVMHEVARDWNTDVACFLKTKGLHIDVEDKWGRTPLFVAVVSNNIDMVKWLIKNGADINHRTIKGERQLPIHYAAKYDAIESFDLLMAYGVNPLERDKHDRTPFCLAAEGGHNRICNHFLDLELPTASYDDAGVSTIDHIISNLPTALVQRALDQFISVSYGDRNILNVYLSCLGKRRWTLLQRSGARSLPHHKAPPCLEIITEKRDMDLISHPVIMQLIKLKRKQYGNKFIQLNNLFHLLFTILWTVAASIRVGDIDTPMTSSPSRRNSILVITLFAQLLTFVFIYKLYLEWKVRKEFVECEKKRKQMRLDYARPLCHPRWGSEMSSLQDRIEVVQNTRFHFWNDGWTVVELLCLFLACVFTIITILWYVDEDGKTIPFHYQIRLFYSAFFVLVVWVRLNRCFRYHQTFGPFVAMLGECAVASSQIGFLFIEFFVPFAVAFWVLFGSTVVKGDGGKNEYFNLNDLLYQLWLLTFIGDYEFDTLKTIAHFDAQVLVGLYFVVVSIITFNIYIALLSEAFARVNENASQRAYLEEAITYTSIERMFPSIKREFEFYLNKHCAPMTVERNKISDNSKDVNTRTVVSNAAKTILDLKNSMSKIVDNEMGMKKDVESVEQRFDDFQKKYTEDSRIKIMKELKIAMKNQSSNVPFSMRQASTHIMECIEKLREKACFF